MSLVAARLPSDLNPAEPTDQQLAAAKMAHAKFGAAYQALPDPKTNQTFHEFIMPYKTTDADLIGLPDLPFWLLESPR